MAAYDNLSALRKAMSDYPEHHLARLLTEGELSGPQQRGPCCGLYAMQHVYNYWAQNGVSEFKNAPVVARKDKNMAGGGANRPTTSLRQYAKQQQLTQIGELLSAENLCLVAQGTGVFDVAILTFLSQREFEAVVTKNIGANCPLLMGFDVQQGTGSPIQKHGNSAHWTVLTGYARNSRGELWIAHFHWGKHRFDSAAAFFESNQQLELILSKDEQWVKHNGEFFANDDPKAIAAGVQGNPVRGDFSRPGLRNVRALAHRVVRLRPRNFQDNDLELIGITQQMCERYEKSLHGFFSVFRSPSKASLSALRQLRTMLELPCSIATKARDLRDMLRHFRKDPSATKKHPTWGDAAGTTFRKYMNEALAGHEYLLN